MTISTATTMTLSFSAGTIYPDTYSMDVVYTLYVDKDTSYSLTKYVTIPYSTATETFLINGVSTSTSTVIFITGSTLTNYLNQNAPIGDLFKTARADEQFKYLSTYTGTGTVFLS